MKRKDGAAEKQTALAKTKTNIAAASGDVINESVLLEHISTIVEKRKDNIESRVNMELTMMYLEIGSFINSVILDGERGCYGKKILATLSPKLVGLYGRGFEPTNIYRMMRFAERLSRSEILSTLSTQLSWSHIVELLPIDSEEAFLYYANDVVTRRLSVRELRHQIDRKAYERREIANANITDESSIPFNVFKDPYILETLGLKENFKEADLEKAILVELESFIMEFGHGLTFVGRQQRFTFDGEDYYPDLLFYHRELKRLIVVELKIGAFKAAYKGQMEMYLKWLNRYERKEGENAPIGLILCTKASRKKIELLELDKSGIAVAEYWTALPPKDELERKINEIMAEARERLARRKSLPMSAPFKQIDYFYEPKDDVLEKDE